MFNNLLFEVLDNLDNNQMTGKSYAGMLLRMNARSEPVAP